MSVTRAIMEERSRDNYAGWREATEQMDEWWRNRESVAIARLEAQRWWSARREMAERETGLTSRIDASNTEATLRAMVEIAQLGRLRNRQYQLLMLLRTRAGGGC